MFLAVRIEGLLTNDAPFIWATTLPLDYAVLTSPALAIRTLVTAVRAVIPLIMARIADRADVLVATSTLDRVPGSGIAIAAWAKNSDILF